ncbi:MAG: S-adenosylmethionine:tRNA ribosyltransferase-isomerase, partial [Chloroflexota bacterium]
MTLTLDDFDYELPTAQIAQSPLEQRDQSRLLHLNRRSGEKHHLIFHDIIDHLNPGDILVLNNSRVIPARLFGQKQTGGKVELLLLKEVGELTWQALVGGKKLVENTEILLHTRAGEPTEVSATIVSHIDGPIREIRFNRSISEWLNENGHTPLPPYIQGYQGDAERGRTGGGRGDG